MTCRCEVFVARTGMISLTMLVQSGAALHKVFCFILLGEDMKPAERTSWDAEFGGN